MAAAPPLFICHAFTEDEFARDLGLALEACRISVWRNTHQLRGNEHLAQDVRWAIEQARHVIVVLGLNTGNLAWLRREIEVAQKAERRRTDTYRVIPLLLPGMDPTVLNHWFGDRQKYSVRDSEFDLIYVNGDNNLENMRRPDEQWKVRRIDDEFHRLMFDTSGMP